MFCILGGGHGVGHGVAPIGIGHVGVPHHGGAGISGSGASSGASTQTLTAGKLVDYEIFEKILIIFFTGGGHGVGHGVAPLGVGHVGVPHHGGAALSGGASSATAGTSSSTFGGTGGHGFGHSPIGHAGGFSGSTAGSSAGTFGGAGAGGFGFGHPGAFPLFPTPGFGMQMPYMGMPYGGGAGMS